MITQVEYEQLKYKQCVHIFNIQGNNYDSGVQVELNDSMLTNEQTSQVEQYEFMTDKPSRLTGYITEDKADNHANKHWIVTTWIGDKLGRVIWKTSYASHGYLSDRVYRITVLGDNGILYYGTGLGVGMYARLTAYKNQENAHKRFYWQLH